MRGYRGAGSVDPAEEEVEEEGDGRILRRAPAQAVLAESAAELLQALLFALELAPTSKLTPKLTDSYREARMFLKRTLWRQDVVEIHGEVEFARVCV